ncbi:efflux transporter outer membrane subunit [Desulfogranum japonicum]|uniref:efflux transporter outer membrane subunit n=1 Tax=Desulfogranum japonicum TaxID=231447 RepID=UPI00041D294D|nr:efflux transporter outer membrane subunit [Desulfogranum japonicum]
MKHTLPVLLFVTVVSLQACAPVGPDFTTPAVQWPKDWQTTDKQNYSSNTAQLAEWWKILSDPTLDELITLALDNNNSLEIAGLRILEARAQLGVATGSLYPQSQLATGQSIYLSPPDNSGVNSNYWNHSLGASASWEIDFWGKLRRGVESADAAYLASIEEYGQARMLLVSQVVESYSALRVAEEQLRITTDNIKLQERSYKITEVLYRNGDSSELDVRQAKTLLLSTQASLPEFEIKRTLARNSLCALLGKMPGTLTRMLSETSAIPSVPMAITIGIPSDTLRNRPDIRAAEYAAMAQNALVGVAEAGLYPSFSLTGSIGLSAGSPTDSSIGSLFESDALTYTIGPSFIWPFLNYGRIKNSIRVQDARLQQALINYRETVLQAAREAENALAQLVGTRRQTTLLGETVSSARHSVELSMLRYNEGFSDYQRVLDSLKSLYTQEQRYIINQGAMISNLTALYLALGGGWLSSPGNTKVSKTSRETMVNRTDWGNVIQTVEEETDNYDSR